MFTIIGTYSDGQVTLRNEFERPYRSPRAGDITNLNGKWQAWLEHGHYGWTFKDVNATVEAHMADAMMADLDALLAAEDDIDITNFYNSPAGQ